MQVPIIMHISITASERPTELLEWPGLDTLLPLVTKFAKCFCPGHLGTSRKAAE